MPLEAVVRCDLCRRTVRKKDTIILDNRRGRARLCRDCQFKEYMKELKDKNPGIDIKLTVEEFSKNLKDGADQR